MEHNPKSTKKTEKKATTTSSGTRNSGTGRTSSRRRTASANKSTEDNENLRTETKTSSERRSGQGADTDYDESYRDARYRGLSNAGEEGDLDYDDSRRMESDRDDDEGYQRNRGMSSAKSFSSEGRQERDIYDDEDQWHRGERGRLRGDERRYEDRDYGYNQEADYNRNWSRHQEAGEDYRRPSGYRGGRSYNQDRYSDGNQGYSRQGSRYDGQRQGSRYDDQWSGGRNQGRYDDDHWERRRDWEDRRYSANSGYGRNWEGQGRYDYDEDRGYGSYQRSYDDSDWSPARYRGRHEYDNDRRYSSNRGDYSDWQRDRSRHMEEDWRPSSYRQRPGQRMEETSWGNQYEDDRQLRNRRY